MNWQRVQPGWWWAKAAPYHADVKRVAPWLWTYSVTFWEGYVPIIVARGWRLGRRRAEEAAAWTCTTLAKRTPVR